jgi:hypothetical protein
MRRLAHWGSPPLPATTSHLLFSLAERQARRANAGQKLAKPDELDPQKHTLSILPLAPVKPVVHTSALDDLRYAVGLYGNVPDEFPPQQ